MPIKQVTTNDQIRLVKPLVLLLIFFVVLHFIFRKIALGNYIGGDYVTMQRADAWVCDFAAGLPLSSGFAFLPRCLTIVTNFIYEVPIVYLAALVLIVFAKFFIVFKIYETLCSNTKNPTLPLLVAAFALLLITIAGGSRFMLGSSSILMHVDLVTRSWAQLLILWGLLVFIQKRYVATTLLICPALLLQAVNTLNLVAVLGLAFLLSANRKDFLRVLPLVLLFACVLAYQYYLIYGPSGPFVRPSDLGAADANGGSIISPQQWYSYVYSQDPDDLSILYHLKLGWVSAGYIGFGILGICLAYRVENAQSFRSLLQRPGIAITTGAYLYLLVCALIEYFQAPGFLLNILIPLQPRRIMYLPVLILCYYVSRFSLEFFLVQEKTTFLRFITLCGYFIFFFAVLFLSSWQDIGFSKKTTLGLFLVALAISSSFFALRDTSYTSRLRSVASRFVLPLLLFMMVLAKTAPHISAKTFSDARALYFDFGPRDYAAYISITEHLHGTDKDFLDFSLLVDWVKKSTPEDAGILVIDLGYKTQVDLHYFTGRRIDTANAFIGNRGGPHYDSLAMSQLWQVIQLKSDLSLGEFTKLGRAKQIEILDSKAIEIYRATGKLFSMSNKSADYLLLRQPCEQLVGHDSNVYLNDSYCLYAAVSE